MVKLGRGAHVSVLFASIFSAFVAGAVRDTSADTRQRPAGLITWLNRYAGGDLEAAQAFAAQPNRGQVARAFPDQARRWIEADPAELAKRRLTAATFVIDAVRHWAGSADWQYARPLLAWGCAALSASGVPTPAERIWHLSAIAVAAGADDWVFVMGRRREDGRPFKTVKDPLTNEENQGHLSHALARFPNEPRLALAAAVAAENMSWVVGGFGRDSNLKGGLTFGEIDPVYVDQLRAGRLVAENGSNDRIPGAKFLARFHIARVDEVRRLRDRYLSLTRLPTVAAEAHVRLALMATRFAEPDEALRHVEHAQEMAHEPYVVYLSYLVAGTVHERQRRDDEAIDAYRAALNVFPRAQSATSLLATLLFGLGRHAEAAALADDFFVSGSGDLAGDPWSTYRLGDFRLLPAYLAQLRAR
jgi:tetratricopeptide (TPR) repeat protein